MKKQVDKLFLGINKALGVITLVGILIITAGVLSRFVFRVSIAWSDEFLRTIFIYGYFIGAALALKQGTLMGLDLLESSLKRKEKTRGLKWLKIVLGVINTAFFSLLTIGMIKIMVPYFVERTKTSTSNTPAWVIPLGFTIGTLMIAGISLARLMRELARRQVS